MKKNELWKKLDAAIDNPNIMMATMEMAALLKQAYVEELNVLAQVYYSIDMPGMAFQAYLGSPNERFMICYSCKEQAKKESRGGDWAELNAKDILNNLFQKSVIAGLVFNSADESRMLIVPRELLQEMIPESTRKA